MTDRDRDLDGELDRLLDAIETPEPDPALAARILAEAPRPKRPGLGARLAGLIMPEGRRWPAGAALASLALGLSTGYAAAAQQSAVDPLSDEIVYEALGLSPGYALLVDEDET